MVSWLRKQSRLYVHHFRIPRWHEVIVTGVPRCSNAVGCGRVQTPVGVSSRVLGAMPQLRASVPCHASASVPPFPPLLPIYSSLPLLFLSSFHTLGSRELAFRTSAWKIVETKLLLPSDYPFSTDPSPSCLAIFQDLPCLQSLCPWCLPGCLRPSFSSEAIWGIKLSR